MWHNANTNRAATACQRPGASFPTIPGTAGLRRAAAVAADRRVLALESPSVADLTQYLSDPDNGVRHTAVATLVEHLPDGYESALLDALADSDTGVRHAAADGFRELVEVLVRPEDLAVQFSSDDPLVRAATIYVVSARGVGDVEAFRQALADADHRVRTEAVRALVSVDDADGVALAAADENREVRVVAAKGLATLQAGAQVIRRLLNDGDPLVRAAALAALGSVGCDDGDVRAVEGALTAPAWQIREGAARALSGATPEVAVPALSRALTTRTLTFEMPLSSACPAGLRPKKVRNTRWAPRSKTATPSVPTPVRPSRQRADADSRPQTSKASYVRRTNLGSAVISLDCEVFPATAAAASVAIVGWFCTR